MTKSFIEVNIQQNTPEWLEWRRPKIGASDAAAILHKDPWTTYLQKWEEKMFCRDRPINENMETGKRLEPFALRRLCHMLGRDFKPTVLQSVRHPALIASLDGWDGESSVEIKIVGHSVFDKFHSGEIPDYYISQLQHQMFLPDTNSTRICAFDRHSFDGEKFTRDPVILNCERDSWFIEDMIHEELEFVRRLIDFDPPEPSDRDWVEIVDHMASNAAREYIRLGAEVKRMEKEMSRQKEIATSCLSHPRVKIDGFKIQKTHRKGNVDYAKIPEIQSVDLEKYRKERSEFWKITA